LWGGGLATSSGPGRPGQSHSQFNIVIRQSEHSRRCGSDETGADIAGTNSSHSQFKICIRHPPQVVVVWVAVLLFVMTQ
jgi:hypothetical protein